MLEQQGVELMADRVIGGLDSGATRLRSRFENPSIVGGSKNRPASQNHQYWAS